MSTDKLASDIQKLEPGARIELFELDARPITGGTSGDVLYFHGYTQVGPIWWQGQQYDPWPIQAEGFELNPQKPPQPTLSVGNVDGSVTALCLSFQDMVGAKLTRHRTLGKYLDVANFPDKPLEPITANATPFGAPDGSTAQFQLQDDQGRPVKDPTITAIHQTDWQGRVELSAMARTNYAPDLAASAWLALGISKGSAVPMGGAKLYTITQDTSSGQHQVNLQSITPLGEKYFFVDAKAGTVSKLDMWFYNNTDHQSNFQFDLASGLVVDNPSPDSSTLPKTSGIIALGGGLYRCWASRASTASNEGVRISVGGLFGTTATGDGTSSVYVGDPMLSTGSIPGVYIPTADAPVTVTDYVNNSDGTITLGQAPQGESSPGAGDAATLDWTGTGTAYVPGGNPDADPEQEFPPDVWFIEQKLSETSEVVQFALSSAMDFGQVQLPRRKIIANYCSWRYRSAECGYTGGAVAKADDTPTTDPEQDVCGHRLSSCKLRFGENNPLPFGGFVAASLTR